MQGMPSVISNGDGLVFQDMKGTVYDLCASFANDVSPFRGGELKQARVEGNVSFER